MDEKRAIEEGETLTRKELLNSGLKLAALGFLGVGVAGISGCSKGGSKRWVMVIDINRCKGCRACEVACKVENNVRLGVWRSCVKESEIISPSGEVKVNFVPWQCNHCEKPSCIDICPVEKDKFGHRATYQRADGTVLIDDKRCIGCGKCVPVCPYKVRFMDPLTGNASKCNLCIHRLDKGLVPACVNTCPAVVRTMYLASDPEFKKIKKRATVLLPEKGTRPAVYYLGLEPEMYSKGEGTKERWASEMGIYI